MVSVVDFFTVEKEGMTNLLTLDNFIFFAGTLGYGEPFEITRGANLVRIKNLEANY